MPPRIRVAPNQLRQLSTPSPQYVCWQCRHASVSIPTTPAPALHQIDGATRPIQRFPPQQPPSHKPPQFRKSQLHRQYQSLLHSSPVMLIFQHNNLKAMEWMGIRRELRTALEKVDKELNPNGDHANIASSAKIQILHTGIFASALKVVEFWDPKFAQEASLIHPTDPRTATSTPVLDTSEKSVNEAVTHGLSEQAWRAVKDSELKHGLEPLLSGPLAVLTMPSVSPQHLKAALSILSPGPGFPAPKRRTTPSYHEPPVQAGIQKLMLLGARVEGKAFDFAGAKWIAGIQGGLEGLRGQLVAMLQSVSAGLTTTLESAGRNLYITMEGRKSMLEDEQKKPEA